MENILEQPYRFENHVQSHGYVELENPVTCQAAEEEYYHSHDVIPRGKTEQIYSAEINITN